MKQRMDSSLPKMINAVLAWVMVVTKGGDMYGLLERATKGLGGGWGCGAHSDAGRLAHALWAYVQRYRWCQIQEQRGGQCGHVAGGWKRGTWRQESGRGAVPAIHAPQERMECHTLGKREVLTVESK